MKIKLAGFNVDRDVLKELDKGGKFTDQLTPEIISAAYARISRSQKTVDELRKVARNEVEKARRSNRSIVFGMGHHSVAEHAVFNFDIIGISRLAVEEVEKFRLCAYTEKSQRYIKLDNEFMVPEEIKDAGLQKEFVNIVGIQNEFYQELYGLLREKLLKQYPDYEHDKMKLRTLEGWAKEDARYITCLATEAQLGLTINARSLELLFRRFASNPLIEVWKIGREMFRRVEKIAPSIILFTEANDFDKKTYPELADISEQCFKRYIAGHEIPKGDEPNPVKLESYTPDPDNVTVASLLHTVSKIPYKTSFDMAKKMRIEEKKDVIMRACHHMELYDSVLREFEYVNLTYELDVSASCFAQLKRHRMATITSQRYSPDRGIKIPQSITEIGKEKEFNNIIDKTNDVYIKIREKAGDIIAQYVLTNAHIKRVLLRVNARELYHISRLREDTSAQWDIREITGEMIKQAKEVMPLTLLLICGKDRYPKVYESIFGKPPKITKAVLPE